MLKKLWHHVAEVRTMLLQVRRHPSAVSTLLGMCLMAVSPVAAQNAAQASAGTPQDVLTYHVDTHRTGWFSSEIHLTPGNVNAASFGLLVTVPLDGRVDAEPLVALGQTIAGQGVHDVVYAATENDSVYAIDAVSGAILWQRSLGTPVPYQYKDGDDNVFPVMGILGTPVIDRTAGAIYLVADLYTGTVDYFLLHAISLSSGKDLVTPVHIQFAQTLSDGTKWLFNPKYQLQRAGLLESNGSIYVSFGSNGDIDPSISRGSIVAYDASTLQPQHADISDKLSLASNPYYLSSIWQSGYAPAADAGGDVYFSTGNSDPHTASYSPSFNRPESVVRLSGDLGAVLTSFTPSNYFSLDGGDVDLGSGGMLLLPDQAGTYPHLAVAGGKDGRAFLIDRDKMGGYTPGGPDKVLQAVSMGACWCGPSYYVGADGTPRVVTGGGNGVTSWKLTTSPATQLVFEAATSSSVVRGLPDNGGVMPVISSNGTTANSAIVWFVQRPASSSDQDPGTPVTLTAFAASNLAQPLVSITAGTWTHAVNSNANIVPTVANGRVYVASNQQLQIFGLLTAASGQAGVRPRAMTPSAPDRVECPTSVAPIAPHDFYATVCQVQGTQLRLALRTGQAVSIDIAGMAQTNPPLLLTLGRPVHVRAKLDAEGAVHALRISHYHTISSSTPPDR
jgi:hypothetical protein